MRIRLECEDNVGGRLFGVYRGRTGSNSVATATPWESRQGVEVVCIGEVLAGG